MPATMERLDAACERQGRDPRSLDRSVMAGVLVGSQPAEVERRTTEQLAILGADEATGRQWLDARRGRWVLGTPDEAQARIDEFRDTGIDRLILQCNLPRDIEHIALMGEIIRLGR